MNKLRVSRPNYGLSLIIIAYCWWLHTHKNVRVVKFNTQSAGIIYQSMNKMYYLLFESHHTTI